MKQVSKTPVSLKPQSQWTAQDWQDFYKYAASGLSPTPAPKPVPPASKVKAASPLPPIKAFGTPTIPATYVSSVKPTPKTSTPTVQVSQSQQAVTQQRYQQAMEEETVASTSAAYKLSSVSPLKKAITTGTVTRALYYAPSNAQAALYAMIRGRTAAAKTTTKVLGSNQPVTPTPQGGKITVGGRIISLNANQQVTPQASRVGKITVGGRLISLPSTASKVSGMPILPTMRLQQAMVKGMGASPSSLTEGLRGLRDLAVGGLKQPKGLEMLYSTIEQSDPLFGKVVTAKLNPMKGTKASFDIPIGFVKGAESLVNPRALTASGALVATGLHHLTTGKAPSKSEFEKKLDVQLGKSLLEEYGKIDVAATKYLDEGYSKGEVHAWKLGERAKAFNVLAEWKKEQLSGFQTHLERYTEDIAGREGELLGEGIFDFVFGKYVVGPALSKLGGVAKKAGGKIYSTVVPESTQEAISYSLKFGKPAKLAASVKSSLNKIKPWTSKKSGGAVAKGEVLGELGPYSKSGVVFDVTGSSKALSIKGVGVESAAFDLSVTPKSGLASFAKYPTIKQEAVSKPLKTLFVFGETVIEVPAGYFKGTGEGFSKPQTKVSSALDDITAKSSVGFSKEPTYRMGKSTRTMFERAYLPTGAELERTLTPFVSQSHMTKSMLRITAPKVPSGLASIPTSTISGLTTGIGITLPSLFRGITQPSLSISTPTRKQRQVTIINIPSTPLLEPPTQKSQPKSFSVPKLPSIPILEEPKQKRKQPSPLPKLPSVPSLGEPPQLKREEPFVVPSFPSPSPKPIVPKLVPTSPKSTPIFEFPPIEILDTPEITRQEPDSEPIFDFPPWQDRDTPQRQRLNIPTPMPSPVLPKAGFKATPFWRGPSGSGESRGGFGSLGRGGWFVRKHPIPTARQFAEGSLKLDFGKGKPSITKLGKRLPRGKGLGGLSVGVSGGRRGGSVGLRFPKLKVGKGLDFGFKKSGKKKRRKKRRR